MPGLFNEILVGRFNRFLQKYLSMKGGPPAAQLASEIGMFIPWPTGKEDEYLRGWSHFHDGAIVPAVAGQTGFFRLRNPPGSNIIALMYKIVFFDSNNANQQWRVSYGHTNPAVTNILGDGITLHTPTLNAEDTRGPRAPVCTTSTDSFPVAPAINVWMGVQGPAPSYIDNAIRTAEEQMPLLPGDTLSMWSNFNNLNFGCMFRWKERFLEDSERT